MTLSRRLLITLAVAFLALIFVGSLGLWRLNQAQQRFEYVQQNIIPSIQELNEVKVDIEGYARLNYRYLLGTSDSNRVAIEQEVDLLSKSLYGHMDAYERTDVSDSNDRMMLETDKVDLAAYRAAIQGFETKVRAGDHVSAQAMLIAGAARDAGARLRQSIDRHIAYNVKLGHDLRIADNEAFERAVWVLVSFVGFALTVSGILGFGLYVSINTGLTDIRGTLQEVSLSLDLTQKAKVKRMDEIGHTAMAFNSLLMRMAEVVDEVRQSAGSVSVASRQISIGNTDLSQRTEEQAASLEETASSMEELTATVRQNADNARQATTLANSASEVARSGGEVVARVVETMHGISGSSAKMAEIITAIESIAFQTNILALNAAVEAARAGEEGRGFAVVAGEVRMLAQRSATAAREVKELIGDSVSRVEAGSKLVDEAGSAISLIVGSVKRVADIVGEIAAASEDQRTGIEQVNQAVIQMDHVTQQNAAVVEQASAAAQAMAEQSQVLQETVAAFRISGAVPSRLPMVCELDVPRGSLREDTLVRTADLPFSAECR
jgi:methyl-accepting chemotaxis protein